MRAIPRQQAGAVEARQADASHGLRLLYVTESDQGPQLRLREFPYPGSEQVLWESPRGHGYVSLMCSPSGTRALLALQEPDPSLSAAELFVVPIGGGEAKRVTTGVDAMLAVWHGEHAINLLTRGLSEWTLDLATDRRTLASKHTEVRDFISKAFPGPLQVLRRVVGSQSIVLPFGPEDASLAIARGTGLPLVPALVDDIPVAEPIAAASKDGKHLGLTGGDDAVFVISVGEYGASVDRVLPLSHLVQGESTWVEDLRWSSDSRYLTFTEVHYHPPGSQTDGTRSFPDPLDWTSLVRLYDSKLDSAATVAVGSQGWVLPALSGE